MNVTSVVTADDAGFHLEETVEIPFESTVQINSETVSCDEADLELVRKSSAGNIAAFEQLYQRYYRRTYSLCLRMLANPVEAEDMTQEVFIQLFKKVGSFRGDSKFSTWLHRLTVNQILMHFRKRNVKIEKMTEDGEIPDQIIPGTENPNKMPVVDKIAIDEAIAELPNGYRTIFVLHDVEGYEHEEISSLLGLSVGTSKSQLHKARLKMRKLLRKTSV
jgi:RNA polymerase sigma-70 factor, ECF subfamily